MSYVPYGFAGDVGQKFSRAMAPNTKNMEDRGTSVYVHMSRLYDTARPKAMSNAPYAGEKEAQDVPGTSSMAK